ncbi:MAG: DUF1501 domain-containing protein [Planctomycetales bacterium]
MPRTDDARRAVHSRRLFLQAGSLAGLGLNLPQLLAARSAETRSPAANSGRAKTCILLYMTGGPAQQETFDPKPEADPETRGQFAPIDTNVPGVRICELLPRLARQAHRCAIIRSTWHESDVHGVGVHYNLTGLKHAPRASGEPQLDRRDPPCIGGVIRQLRGDRNGLPAAVHLPVRIGDQNNVQWGGQHAGFLGPNYDPLMLIDENWLPGEPMPGSMLPKGVDERRAAVREELLARFGASYAVRSPQEEAHDRMLRQAFDILHSSAAFRAFRIDDERPETRARYGDNKFGRSCLVARRLVEAGVGLVTVPWMHLFSPVATTKTPNFDTHFKHFDLMRDHLCPPADQAFAALLDDLAERGMLDETLVAWTGEFGRTPKINGNAGRDHWGKVYSTVLAGGGVRGGIVHGASDRNGGAPAESPVHVTDFVATIYHALGYGPTTRVVDVAGRPHFVVQGTPVRELF